MAPPQYGNLPVLALTNEIAQNIASAPEVVKSAVYAHVGAIRALTRDFACERLLESLARAVDEAAPYLVTPGDVLQKGRDSLDIDT